MINQRYLVAFIRQYNLDLKGLTIYTEAASGPYLYAPILAALAGAKVYAEAKDTRYGTAVNVINELNNTIQKFGLEDYIEVFEGRSKARLGLSDIITNSGNVRPFDHDLIDALKSTAVIPLMWETWEYRPADFDLNYCKKKGIVVLGTNERLHPCDMEYFIGLTALKLLMESGFDGGKILIMGNSPLPGLSVVTYFKKIGISLTWFSEDPKADYNYAELKDYWQRRGSDYNLIFLVDHHFKNVVIGSKGLLSFEEIIRVNKTVKLSIMCGNIDINGLYKSGLEYYPSKIAPFGFVTYQPFLLGPRPVLSLFAAGLKVGEAMARARHLGCSVNEVVKQALKISPAMDFEGELAWL